MLDPKNLCQIELPVADVARSLRFYRETFGWQASPAEVHEYLILEVPEDCSFGISLVPRGMGAVQPSVNGPVLYFSSSDPESIVAKAEAAGGRRILGPVRYAGYGPIWQLADPDGHRFGLVSKPKNQDGP